VDLCCIGFGFNIFMFLPVLRVMKRTGCCLIVVSGSQKISEQPSLQLRHVSRVRRLTLTSSVHLKEDWGDTSLTLSGSGSYGFSWHAC